ncbi:MAG TPA: hypothetical protein VHL57_06330, partial [Flavobacteriales bacterium]|nr:hypothetical protein [Flavobacteriales bacterium]
MIALLFTAGTAAAQVNDADPDSKRWSLTLSGGYASAVGAFRTYKHAERSNGADRLAGPGGRGAFGRMSLQYMVDEHWGITASAAWATQRALPIDSADLFHYWYAHQAQGGGSYLRSYASDTRSWQETTLLLGVATQGWTGNVGIQFRIAAGAQRAQSGGGSLKEQTTVWQMNAPLRYYRSTTEQAAATSWALALNGGVNVLVILGPRWNLDLSADVCSA